MIIALQHLDLQNIYYWKQDFHQKNHLNASLLDVVLQVHAVFYQLDDGEDEVGVAQPTEYVIENRQVFVFHALGNTMREGRKYHAMDIGKLVLDGARHGERIVVGIQITRSMSVVFSTALASSVVDTCVNVGG